MAKKKKTDHSESNGNCALPIDAELLEYIKRCESDVEDSRLAHEEAKAKYGLSKAEHRLLIAKRNRLIAKTENPAEVEDAQRGVDNSKSRMAKAHTVAVSAKDEWKGCEERLAKAFTEKERMPLLAGQK